jgi:hypothetical protein
LLVAISIITVIAGISYALVQKALQRAYAMHCTGNLRELGSALQLYIGDHHGNFPTLVSARHDKDSEEPALDNTLDEYATNPEVFHCRADHGHFFEKTGVQLLLGIRC